MKKIYYGVSDYKTPEQFKKMAVYNHRTNRTYIVCSYKKNHSMLSCTSYPTLAEAKHSAQRLHNGPLTNYICITSYKK